MPAAIRRLAISRPAAAVYAQLVDNTAEVGVAEVAVLIGFLAATLASAGLIWLMTRPESLVALSHARSLWDVLASLAGQLIAIL